MMLMHMYPGSALRPRPATAPATRLSFNRGRTTNSIRDASAVVSSEQGLQKMDEPATPSHASLSGGLPKAVVSCSNVPTDTIYRQLAHKTRLLGGCKEKFLWEYPIEGTEAVLRALHIDALHLASDQTEFDTPFLFKDRASIEGCFKEIPDLSAAETYGCVYLIVTYARAGVVGHAAETLKKYPKGGTNETRYVKKVPVVNCQPWATGVLSTLFVNTGLGARHFDRERVVALAYVGQTGDVRQRLKQHSRDKEQLPGFLPEQLEVAALNLQKNGKGVALLPGLDAVYETKAYCILSKDKIDQAAEEIMASRAAPIKLVRGKEDVEAILFDLAEIMVAALLGTQAMDGGMNLVAAGKPFETSTASAANKRMKKAEKAQAEAKVANASP